MIFSKIRVEVENFRAIESADIVINGITVVAGENGSGKSSLSKLLYYSYKTACNYDSIVLNSLRGNFLRYEHFFSIIISELEQVSNNKNIDEEFRYLQQLKDSTRIGDITNEIVDDWINFGKRIENNIEVQLSRLDSKSPSRERINKRIQLILKDILGNTYDNELSIFTNFRALVKLIENWKIDAIEKIKSRPIDVFLKELSNNLPQYNLPNSFKIFEDDVLLLSKSSKSTAISFFVQNVVYIDTPMMLGVSHYSENTYWDDLNEMLQLPLVNTYNINIQSINAGIINGDVELDENNLSDSNFIFTRTDGSQFDLSQCATGIKSFAILQLLLKNGTLNNKTLLIIDEPEAHLHPQWIIEYARLIVMLNKEVGINFFIASHSPDMVSAIRYISEKEGTLDNVNFYLAESSPTDKFRYNYKKLGNNIEPVFASFNISIDRMDKYTL